MNLNWQSNEQNFIENTLNMKEADIDSIREKYPVKFDELCRYSSFEQILGKTSDEYTPEERKKRWEKVMSTDREMKRNWTDTEACEKCISLNVKDAWCRLVELPCTVNPILSFCYGMTGMACCGCSYKNAEPGLFDEDEDEPLF
jgi:hypothetical protein